MTGQSSTVRALATPKEGADEIYDVAVRVLQSFGRQPEVDSAIQLIKAISDYLGVPAATKDPPPTPSGLGSLLAGVRNAFRFGGQTDNIASNRIAHAPLSRSQKIQALQHLLGTPAEEIEIQAVFEPEMTSQLKDAAVDEIFDVAVRISQVFKQQPNFDSGKHLIEAISDYLGTPDDPENRLDEESSEETHASHEP
ncbi:MAG: hypothetical protein JWL65_144 [Gammaproteobacteria bacterium]|nr:hypothetical protein [Gammaproteobacteria bacterium]